MYRYKKLMVGLSLDDYDPVLIQYAGFISKMAESSDVYFVHVSDNFDIPEEIQKLYPEVLAPVDEAVKTRMADAVEQHFDGYDQAAVHYEAVEGQVLGNLISLSQAVEIDLMIIGHSTNQSERGSLSEKLVRKAFCSVLIVPDDARVKLDRILVAMDFSDRALDSLDVGSAFAKAAGDQHMDIINTYQVPRGYYKTGKSFEEFAGIMLENAKVKTRKLISRADLKDVNIRTNFKMADDVAGAIQEFATDNQIDLLVVGARGRSGDIAAILLGSVTESLIRSFENPLIAVKKKGEGLNVLEALATSF